VAIFPRLATPTSYRACDTDLLTNHAARAYWLGLFASHAEVQFDAARETGVTEDTINAARAAWRAEIEELSANPARDGRLDILHLDVRRRAVLVAHGIVDEFRHVKARENRRALEHLPQWLADLDRTSGAMTYETIVRGMLAGNLFDMGVTSTSAMFEDGEPTFADMLRTVPDRPWHHDQLDAFTAWITGTPPANSVIFADNAGADIVLGVLPLARQLLRARDDARVIIAANELPSLNDVTADEVLVLFDEATAYDRVYESERLRVMSTGTAAPLIDLAAVSEAFARACEAVDFVVVVGMGRGIESNWTASFDRPALRVALLKDPQVARTVGGTLFDAVVRFN
jgi:type II pantothenate kinase